MSELLGREERKEALKRIIRRLHEGADPEELKEEFREIVKGATPDLIARVEEELIQEGMPREEVQRLCDLHLALFRESIESAEVSAPEWHPIHILMQEHKLLMETADELRRAANEIGEAGDLSAVPNRTIEKLERIIEHLKGSESHYLREENALFPYLERHGITQPPAIMWAEHDRIREIKKGIYETAEGREGMSFEEFKSRLKGRSIELAEMLSSHFYKENNILFPTAMRVISEGEWIEIRREFDSIGYCPFTPQPAEPPSLRPAEVGPREEPGRIELETGSLTKEELEAILNTLPVDITFVDKEDTVRYFNQSRDRIFLRTKAVIGRKVQQCHPPKEPSPRQPDSRGVQIGEAGRGRVLDTDEGQDDLHQVFPR